jgi:predicted hotdog family 3-hydroxylacyl-ACP dehydratase
MNMKRSSVKQGEELLEYIPQRPPFVMVDKLLEKGDDYVVTGLRITEDNVLVEHKQFKESGLVENIAQTAALFAGLRFAEQGKAIPVGYIAGIKDLSIEQMPSSGTDIYTRTTLTRDIGNIQVVEGVVFDQEEHVLASCELRIFIKGEE